MPSRSCRFLGARAARPLCACSSAHRRAAMLVVILMLTAALPALRASAAVTAAARYPIAVVKHATDPARATAFVDFVCSDAGRRALAQYGFLAP